MAIMTGTIAKALRPGVNTWFGLTYNEIPEKWSQLFEINNSDMNFEEDVGLSGFGLAPVKAQGQGISYDDMKQNWIQRYTHVTYALGFTISREAIEDNLYVQLAKDRTESLAMSMRQTREVVAHNVLIRAFNSSYTGGDGLCLGNSAHLLGKGGTFANTPAVPAQLSEASLEQSLIDITGFVNDANLRIGYRGRRLVIPKELWFEATRILKSPDRYNTAERSINAMYEMGVLPEGYLMSQYLTSATNWFVLTDCPKGLRYFDRRGLEVDNDTDFDSENMKFKSSMRFSVSWTDPRGIYCVNA